MSNSDGHHRIGDISQGDQKLGTDIIQRSLVMELVEVRVAGFKIWLIRDVAKGSILDTQLDAPNTAKLYIHEPECGSGRYIELVRGRWRLYKSKVRPTLEIL